MSPLIQAVFEARSQAQALTDPKTKLVLYCSREFQRAVFAEFTTISNRFLTRRDKLRLRLKRFLARFRKRQPDFICCGLPAYYSSVVPPNTALLSDQKRVLATITCSE